MKMGLPAVITTDQGCEFKNQLNNEIMKILNIRHCLITAYHPQVDKIKRVGEGVLRRSVENCNSGQRDQLTPHTISLKIFVSNVLGVEENNISSFLRHFNLTDLVCT